MAAATAFVCCHRNRHRPEAPISRQLDNTVFALYNYVMTRLLAVLLLLATSASAATQFGETKLPRTEIPRPAQAVTQSDAMVVFTTRIRKPDAGTASTFDARVQNESGETLQNVTLVLTLHGNATISASSTPFMTCTSQSARVVRCHAAIPLADGGSYAVPASISQVDERRLAVAVTAEWSKGAQRFTTEPKFDFVLFPRQLEVTTTAGEGPGSFRATLDHANASCLDIPCEITFGSGGRISLNAPLAPITAPDIIINGGGTTILDGVGLSAGNGLAFVGKGVFEVRNIHITRFPSDGIAISREVPEGPFRSLIHGAVIDRNGSRGITVNPTANAVAIESSTISLNGQGGAFIVDARDVRLDLNTIAGNGGSGVSVSAASRQVVLYRNELRDNHQWGVTIGRGAELVHLSDNMIFGNGIAGIDVGIDGPDGFVYNPGADQIGPPALTSATLNSTTGKTTVSGIVPGLTGTWDVTLYFSTRPGQADGFLGHTIAVNGAFSLVLLHKLPAGSYIIASAVHELNGKKWSTELSNNVQAP